MKRSIYSSSLEAKVSSGAPSRGKTLQSQFRKQRSKLQWLGMILVSQTILCAAIYGVYIAYFDAGPSDPAYQKAAGLFRSQPWSPASLQMFTNTIADNDVIALARPQSYLSRSTPTLDNGWRPSVYRRWLTQTTTVQWYSRCLPQIKLSWMMNGKEN